MFIHSQKRNSIACTERMKYDHLSIRFTGLFSWDIPARPPPPMSLPGQNTRHHNYNDVCFLAKRKQPTSHICCAAFSMHHGPRATSTSEMPLPAQLVTSPEWEKFQRGLQPLPPPSSGGEPTHFQDPCFWEYVYKLHNGDEVCTLRDAGTLNEVSKALEVVERASSRLRRDLLESAPSCSSVPSVENLATNMARAAHAQHMWNWRKKRRVDGQGKAAFPAHLVLRGGKPSYARVLSDKEKEWSAGLHPDLKKILS